MANNDYDDMILPDDFVDSEDYRLEGNLPDDTQAHTTEPETSENGLTDAINAISEQVDTNDPANANVDIAPATIKVKYNHEEREIGLDEAAVLAQKGLNYDKLDERMRGYEASNSRFEKLAKNLGYESIEEMMDAAEENFVNARISDLVDAGNTEAMARFLVEQEMAKAAPTDNEQTSGQQSMPNSVSDAAPISDARKGEIDEFVRAYPGVVNLPPEVIEDHQRGVRLLVAYERFQNKAALEELKILKQNQASAAMAPVTGVTGKAGPRDVDPEETDPFLKGFNSAY